MKIYKHLTIKWRELVFILFLSIFSFNINAQEIDSLIIWNKNYKLSWDDFQGSQFRNKYISSNKNEVVTISKLSLTGVPAFYKNNLHSFYIYATFNRLGSSTANYRNDVLVHEQLHFDIQELYARKIRKHFEELKKTTSNRYTFYKIFNLYQDSLELYQKKYDSSTNHSVFCKNQKKWNKKISNHLKRLESYSIKNLYGIKDEN